MRNQRPIASMWRFWTQGDDVYLANRNLANHTRVSLHASGTWFCSVGNLRKNLATPFLLPGGEWLHALELAFLIPDDSLPLRELRPLKPSKTALLIETPSGHKLTLNVLYGAAGTAFSTPLPAMMQGHILMQARLTRGTAVVVIGRLHPYSDQDRQTLGFHRETQGLRIHTDTPVDRPGLELLRVTASRTGGNVITVVGMGMDAFTTDPPPSPTGG